MSEATSEPKRALSEGEIGVALAIGAHLVWGGMAFYFGLLRHISPVEIAVNRGLWSLPVAALIVSLLGQWADVRRAMANPRIVITLAFCSFIIVFNWGFYVWSIPSSCPRPKAPSRGPTRSTTPRSAGVSSIR
jgi:chloramphenicol-sensitive protein RarD